MLSAGIVGFGGLGHVHANSLWQLDNVTVEVETESGYLRELKYFLGCVAGERENVRCRAESTRESIRLAREEKRLITGA